MCVINRRTRLQVLFLWRILVWLSSHAEAWVFLRRLDLESQDVLPLVVGRLEFERGLEGRDSDRVIEVTIFVEPLHTQVVLASLLKRLVDGGEVLQAPLRADKLVSGVVGRVVLQAEAQRQPSLLDFGVGVGGHAEVRVDEGENWESHLALVLQKCRVEDSLEV